MYVPGVFSESNRERLFDFIEQHNFGLMISQVEEAPFATHLPFLLERTEGPQGTLLGHLARANPHWKHLAHQSVLVVFAGPHAYITPRWYEADEVVPTWNYTAVHVYGDITLVEDEVDLIHLLSRMVHFEERRSDQPWTMDPTETFLTRLLRQIVGFRLTITRIEGKFKLSQNQPRDRRLKVIQALEQQGDDESRAMAQLIRQAMPPSLP
ncbi:MAG: FMN-binding negative transcriptional regulator [Gemmataceae bacterium]